MGTFDSGITSTELVSLTVLCRFVLLDLLRFVHPERTLATLTSPRAQTLGRAMMLGEVPSSSADRIALRQLIHVAR